MGQRTAIRKASIATAILVLALGTVPSASAVCVGPGEEPWWWPDGSCSVSRLPLPPNGGPDNWFVCVSNNVGDCLP